MAEIERLQDFHREDMRVTNASADFHIKECARLRKQNERLMSACVLTLNGLKRGNVKAKAIINMDPQGEWKMETLNDVIEAAIKL